MLGSGWLSRDGGNAVRWAREVLSADVVIGTGEITGEPDVKLVGQILVTPNTGLLI